MNLRTATPADRQRIPGLHAIAFPESAREMVSNLVEDLLVERTTPHLLSLLAEIDTLPAGHVAFSLLFRAGHEDLRGYIQAPPGCGCKAANLCGKLYTQSG